MKKNLIIAVIISIFILFSVGSSATQKTINKNSTFLNTQLSNNNAPTWDIGTVWTYNVDTIDFTFSEVENRYIYMYISTDELKVEVTDQSESSYFTEISTQSLSVKMDINLDLNLERGPIILTLNFSNATLNGLIEFNKEDLGILNVECTITGLIELESLPIEIPEFILNILPTIPITINMEASFENPFVIIDFPLNTEKTWGLQSNNITVDGTIESVYFKLAYILNKVANIFGKELIPQELAQFLPIMDISEMLESRGISNIFEITKTDVIEGRPVFEFTGTDTITVEAGTYNTQYISIVDDIGVMHYSPDTKSVIQISGNIKEFIPIIENIKVELKDAQIP